MSSDQFPWTATDIVFISIIIGIGIAFLFID
jgi:hypothetical protein